MNKITRILVKPNTFNIYKYQQNQNPYIDIQHNVSLTNVMMQHNKLEKVLSSRITYKLNNPQHNLPDIVFMANGGLCIPNITNTVILPFMKYHQRKEELPYLEKIYESIKLNTIQFPGSDSAPFEGQAELKWFHNGTKAICGYGHRSTQETFTIIEDLFNQLFKKNKLIPPKLLVLPLESPDYYHLDVAMLEFDDSKCIVHKKAFSNQSIELMKRFLGDENIHVIDTNDTMCLNAIVDNKILVTHKITDLNIKSKLEKITNKKIIEVDTSEFEKSGGSVRCMTLDVFSPNLKYSVVLTNTKRDIKLI